jgi:hypothetical protein
MSFLSFVRGTKASIDPREFWNERPLGHQARKDQAAQLGQDGG